MLAKTTLAPLLIRRGDYGEAQAVLNLLPQNDVNQTEFVALHQWILDILQSGRSYAQMDSTEEAALRLVQQSGTPAAAGAEAILEIAKGETFELYYEPEPEGGQRRASEPSEGLPNHDLLCYPSPAQDRLYVQYKKLAELQQPQWQVHDLQGRLLIRQHASTEKEQVLDIAGLADGLYLISIKDQQRVVARQKVLIIH